MRIPSTQITQSATPPSRVTGPSAQIGKSPFVRTLTEAVSQVNRMQLQSAKSGRELSAGSAQSIHKVVLEAEEASLSMQMVVSVRNKALEAYQEVMRMQV